MAENTGPVLIELPDDDGPTPSEVPPVPDPDPELAPRGQAMATVAALAARKPSLLARWFWRLLLAVVTTWISVAAWRFATGLVDNQPILGWAVSGLLIVFVGVCVALVIKEIAALRRLSRIDTLHHEAEAALAADDLTAARAVATKLETLYASREDTRWGRARLAERRDEVFDAEGVLALSERTLLAPLDQAARAEVEAAARQVATVTALVPLALADVFAALTANMRMIRRIAEIYGGRSGTLGAWRLIRAVVTHLVATGVVAAGDDLLEPLVGSGLLGKLSRRFGEGMVNGALTARVGVAAMEVCRPLPFRTLKAPTTRGIVRSSLGGLFGASDKGS